MPRIFPSRFLILSTSSLAKLPVFVLKIDCEMDTTKQKEIDEVRFFLATVFNG